MALVRVSSARKSSFVPRKVTTTPMTAKLQDPTANLQAASASMDQQLEPRGGGSSVTPQEAKRAKISFVADVVWTIVNILFLKNWITSMPDGTTGPFDAGFMKAGFCNYPDTQVFDTQLTCGVFDISMATGTAYVWRKDPQSGVVIYLLAHGLVHLGVALDLIKPDKDVTWEDPVSVIALAAILAMGPVGIYQNMETAGKPEWACRLVAGLAEVFFVWLYVSFLKKGVYALTYINIVINLCVMGSRLLLFGWRDADDIKYRIKSFGKYFWPYIVSCSAMILVMWIEPIKCSQWFADVGGHIWFDVSLFLLMLVGIFNALAAPKKELHRSFY